LTLFDVIPDLARVYVANPQVVLLFAADRGLSPGAGRYSREWGRNIYL